jgi:hypothetical protein
VPRPVHGRVVLERFGRAQCVNPELVHDRQSSFGLVGGVRPGAECRVS